MTGADPKQKRSRSRLDVSSALVKPFEAPAQSLRGIDSETAATLIAAAADVSLVIDATGIVKDVAFGSEELSREGYEKWIGQPWIDTVTVESRTKVEALLRDAAANSITKWRQVNHPSTHGPDVPILYSAALVPKNGSIIVFGRDLRSLASLQQRLMDAQQSLERDYWRLRHLETRYRLLFEVAAEAVLIVDSVTQKITEANPAAGQLLGEHTRRVVGRVFPDCFDEAGASSVRMLMANVGATGRGDEIEARVAESGRQVVISASVFRQDNSALFLLRLSPLQQSGATAASLPRTIARAIDSAPDGFVVTDPEGRILVANQAFRDLAQLASEDQAKGESLDRWLGRAGVDFGVLIFNLRQHGAVRLFATTIRGEQGARADVEISAVSVAHGEQPCLGFTIRNVGRRLASEAANERAVPRSVEQLTELVGRAPLKELVRQSTDLIERLCIEAALELTRDNRASAAEMLGLSRQGLYTKLRRYGLVESPDADGSAADSGQS